MMDLAHMCPPGGPSQYPNFWTLILDFMPSSTSKARTPAGQACSVLPPALIMMGHVDFTGSFLERRVMLLCPSSKYPLSQWAHFTSSTPCGAAACLSTPQASSRAP